MYKGLLSLESLLNSIQIRVITSIEALKIVLNISKYNFNITIYFEAWSRKNDYLNLCGGKHDAFFIAVSNP